MKANFETVKEYMSQNKSFVWIVYLTNHKPYMEIKPTYVNWEVDFGIDYTYPTGNKLSVLMEMYPNLIVLENFIHEDLDSISKTFGIPKSYIWDQENKEYRAFMMFFKDGQFVKHSIGECFCLDTLLKNISEIIPESFEPSGVS